MAKKVKIILFIAVIVIGIWLWRNYNMIELLKYDLSESQDLIDEYRDALNEANDNIDQANSSIEDAQSYAWSSYEDMGWALDNLETIDTVSEPYSASLRSVLPRLHRLPKLPTLP